MEHVAKTLEVGGSKPCSCLWTLTNFREQLGNNIDTSIASVCLENLDSLNDAGVNREIVYNTVGAVYVGKSPFSPNALPLIVFAGMSDTVRVMITAPGRLLSFPSFRQMLC